MIVTLPLSIGAEGSRILRRGGLSAFLLGAVLTVPTESLCQEREDPFFRPFGGRSDTLRMTLLQDLTKSEPGPCCPVLYRFQIAQMGQRILLLDAASGDTWLLEIRKKMNGEVAPSWVPIARSPRPPKENAGKTIGGNGAKSERLPGSRTSITDKEPDPFGCPDEKSR